MTLDAKAAVTRIDPPAGGRWGVLGGTFDPVHLGHLLMAEAAREHHRLDRVLFLLTPVSPHKAAHPPIAYDIRRRLLEAALNERGDDAFTVCTIEAEREGPYYTADTLPLIRARFPEVGEWFFVLGGDSALSLPRWHVPQHLAEYMRLAVLPRPGADLSVLRERLAEIFPPDRVAAILADVVPDAPFVGISATQVRERAAAGRSLRYLVPEAVRALLTAERPYSPQKKPSGH